MVRKAVLIRTGACRGAPGAARPLGCAVVPGGEGMGFARRLLPSLGVLLVLLLALLSVALDAAEEAASAAEQTASPRAERTGEAAADADAAEPLSAEEQRRLDLTQAHGADVAEAILAGKVLLDMTTEQVVLARGEPVRKEVIPPDAELWHYPAGEVAFAQGKVSYVSLTAVAPASTGIQSTPAAKHEDAWSNDAVQTADAAVDRPTIRVGDTYVYRSMDLNNPSASLTTRRTVTATTPTVVMSSLNLDSKRARPRTLRFDGQWNLLASRSPDGSGRDYAPALAYYDFPLVPGKTWERTTTETNIQTRATRIHQIAGGVDQWETVSVPAGTFRAIRVSLRTELEDPSTGERTSGTDVSWYVPELRRSVKSVITGKGGSRQVIELLRYRLAAAP